MLRREDPIDGCQDLIRVRTIEHGAASVLRVLLLKRGQPAGAIYALLGFRLIDCLQKQLFHGSVVVVVVVQIWAAFCRALALPRSAVQPFVYRVVLVW